MNRITKQPYKKKNKKNVTYNQRLGSLASE